DAFYSRILEWAMSHRAVVALMALLVLASSVPLFMVTKTLFLPVDDQDEFEINLRAPEGTSLEATELIANRVATALHQRIPEVQYTMVTVAGDAAKTRNVANVYVRLTPVDQRRRDQFALMGVARSEILPTLGGSLRTSVQPVANIGGGGGQNADIQFLING